MKNVTIALDDVTHRKARVRAAELGTSLSALVKQYLVELANQGDRASGVREMPLSFHGAPGDPGLSKPRTPPYLVDGKKVWTKDGKPRRPGAMRGMGGWSADFDEWPEGFLDAIHGDETEAADQWWRIANNRPDSPGD
jgi:hypothetical protein